VTQTDVNGTQKRQVSYQSYQTTNYLLVYNLIIKVLSAHYSGKREQLDIQILHGSAATDLKILFHLLLQFISECTMK